MNVESCLLAVIRRHQQVGPHIIQRQRVQFDSLFGCNPHVQFHGAVGTGQLQGVLEQLDDHVVVWLRLVSHALDVEHYLLHLRRELRTEVKIADVLFQFANLVLLGIIILVLDLYILPGEFLFVEVNQDVKQRLQVVLPADFVAIVRCNAGIPGGPDKVLAHLHFKVPIINLEKLANSIVDYIQLAQVFPLGCHDVFRL